MNSYIKKTMIVMGLAIAFPSTILGTFFFFYKLFIHGYISYQLSLVFFIVVVTYFLVLMVKYGMAKKN